MKNIRSIPLLLLSLLILVGLSGCGTDYTNCFSFEPAEVVTDLRANEIAINYTISNVEENGLSHKINLVETLIHFHKLLSILRLLD